MLRGWRSGGDATSQNTSAAPRKAVPPAWMPDWAGPPRSRGARGRSCAARAPSERSALSDRQRSLNNLCILASLNRSHEFKVHFRGALRNGCTLDELRDTLVQIMVYAGVPAGVEAFRLAREVLADEGVEPGPKESATG